MELNEKDLKKLRSSMMITRIFCVLPCLLFLVIIIGGMLLWGEVSVIVDEVKPMVEELVPVAEQLKDVDLKQLTETVAELKTTVGEVDWVELSEKINKLDVEELNTAIKNMNDLSEKLSKITSIFK